MIGRSVNASVLTSVGPQLDLELLEERAQLSKGLVSKLGHAQGMVWFWIRHSSDSNPAVAWVQSAREAEETSD